MGLRCFSVWTRALLLLHVCRGTPELPVLRLGRDEVCSAVRVRLLHLLCDVLCDVGLQPLLRLLCGSNWKAELLLRGDGADDRAHHSLYHFPRVGSLLSQPRDGGGSSRLHVGHGSGLLTHSRPPHHRPDVLHTGESHQQDAATLHTHGWPCHRRRVRKGGVDGDGDFFGNYDCSSHLLWGLHREAAVPTLQHLRILSVLSAEKKEVEASLLYNLYSYSAALCTTYVFYRVLAVANM